MAHWQDEERAPWTADSHVRRPSWLVSCSRGPTRVGRCIWLQPRSKRLGLPRRAGRRSRECPGPPMRLAAAPGSSPPAEDQRALDRCIWLQPRSKRLGLPGRAGRRSHERPGPSMRPDRRSRERHGPSSRHGKSRERRPGPSSRHGKSRELRDLCAATQPAALCLPLASFRSSS